MPDKKYAKIGGYGSLVIPISLLEKIVEQGYIVQTTYNSTRAKHHRVGYRRNYRSTGTRNRYGAYRSTHHNEHYRAGWWHRDDH